MGVGRLREGLQGLEVVRLEAGGSDRGGDEGLRPLGDRQGRTCVVRGKLLPGRAEVRDPTDIQGLSGELSGRGPTLPDFIEGIGRDGSVTNDARGPHRAFWPYESVLEGADTPVPNRFLARACGESRGLQVLEETPAGHQLNSYAPDHRHVLEGLVEHFKFNSEELDTVHGQAWDALSDRFA
ncbi:hypothetical protein [Streptomyces sp. NPDC127112]|uniref:hypothetical protein n=1 Tax=Streptomyces sp. NPDC127112 TaxID=3345364 RepID=UPI00362BF181